MWYIRSQPKCCRVTCGILKFRLATNYKRPVWWKPCHTVRQTVLLSTLQQLLEMSAFYQHTCSKMLTPPVNCIVNDALVHVVPNVQQMLLQFVNAGQLRLMHSLLDVTTYLAIHRIKVGVIRRPQIWMNESGCWLLKKSHSVAWPLCRCAVVLNEVAWHVAHYRQQLLRQEHVMIGLIAAVDLHARMDKDEVREAKLWDADGRWKNFENRLGFDRDITISWWSTFFWRQRIACFIQ